MNRLLLNTLDLQRVELLIEHLNNVHDDTLVNLLPQVSTEDLNKGNLESWNLSVHENARQIELNLETDVDVGTVDRRRPPESETTIWNLRQTGALCVRQLLAASGKEKRVSQRRVATSAARKG